MNLVHNTNKAHQFSTCAYFKGIDHTEEGPCCDGKQMTEHKFILCGVDNVVRVHTVCLFCPVYKEKSNVSKA